MQSIANSGGHQRRPGLLLWLLCGSLTLVGCSAFEARQAQESAVPVLADTTPEPPDADLRPPAFADAPQPVLPNDVLARISREFRWEVHAETPQVDRWIQYYRDQPDEFAAILTRAEPYLHHISSEIRTRQLPMELALLPFVESGFNPRARSPSGAAGLWQFMPSTGRALGLEQNWWVDERLSVVRSTESALDYLEYLHKRFDGDWLLALAAYNTGEGNVASELRRSHSSADFWSLHLNAETRNYVPKLLAVVQLIKGSDIYGMALPKWPDQPYFASLNVSQQLDMRKLLELSGQLGQLNAQYIQNITFPQTGSEILVPADQLPELSETLAVNAEQWAARYQRYQVNNGDTLGQIAERHRVNLNALMTVNNLRGHLIRPGQNLLIPVALATQPTPGNSSAIGMLSIRVRQGDTLSVIAERYQMRLSDLLALNQIDSHTPIYPNQELRVRIPTREEDPVVYQVASGDSLSVIANRFNVGLEDLLTWNGLHGREVIYPGQELSIWIN